MVESLPSLNDEFDQIDSHFDLNENEDDTDLIGLQMSKYTNHETQQSKLAKDFLKKKS